MRRIFLPNIEDVAPHNDVLYEKTQVMSKLLFLVPRSLFCIGAQDIIIVPFKPDEDFIRYFSLVSFSLIRNDFYIVLSRTTRPYSLIESILQDEEVLNKLKNLSGEGDFIFDAYMNTPRVVELSKVTGIPYKGTKPALVEKGFIYDLNDKCFFKQLSGQLGVEVVPFIATDELGGIKKAVKEFTRQGISKLIIKKGRYGAGEGNLIGGPAELLRKLPLWYNTGGVVVEPFLDLVEVVGSLVDVKHSYYEWRKTDRQVIIDNKWCGFNYPYRAAGVADIVKKQSVKYAEALCEMGARGYLNIDWGIVRDDAGNLRPLALEINFRHNGFAYILDFAERYFGVKGRDMCISYHETEALGRNVASFSELLGRLGGLYAGDERILIDLAGRKEGAIVTYPPHHGKFGLAIFGESSEYLDEAYSKIKEAVS